jgi:hypothetical protein
MGDEERLEQRIKTLEYEFKILKNEIQRTLLDIQEQVLMHYYPTLRADDAGAEAEVQQSLRAVQEKKQTAAPPEPTTRVTLASAPPAPSPSVPAVEVPVVAKKVSLDDVRQARGEAPPPADGASAEAPALIGGVEQATAIALSAWVNTSANKIGGERLTKLVETAAMRGSVTQDVRNVVMKLVSLGVNGASPAVVPVNDSLKVVTKLYEIVGRPASVEEAINIIDEARVG